MNKTMAAVVAAGTILAGVAAASPGSQATRQFSLTITSKNRSGGR